MATTVDLDEAKDQLSSLLDRATSGEEVVIARDGQPLVKLVPVLRPKKGPRKPSGLMKIKWISPDFDDPLPPDLRKAFGIDS